jgi:hypothetical protein
VNNKGIGRFSEIWNMGHFLDISLDYMGDGCYYFSKKIVDIFSEKACFKKPVLPEKPVKKPAFNLPAGFFNKTWGFSSPDIKYTHF